MNNKSDKTEVTMLFGAGATAAFLPCLATDNLTDEFLREETWNEYLEDYIERLEEEKDSDKDNTEKIDKSIKVIRSIKQNLGEIMYLLDFLNENFPESFKPSDTDKNFESIIYLLDEYSSVLENVDEGDDLNMSKIHSLGGLLLYFSGFSDTLELLKEKPSFKRHYETKLPSLMADFDSDALIWRVLPYIAREIINSIIINRCNNHSVNGYSEGKKLYENFMDEFLNNAEDCELNIFSLNYDPILYESFKEFDLDTGFETREYESDKNSEEKYFFKGFTDLSSKPFLGFLHGFVGFVPPPPKENPSFAFNVGDIKLNDDYKKAQLERLIRCSYFDQLSAEGDIIQNDSLITGLNKNENVAKLPYSAFYYKFVQAIQNSDKIVFVGYSFEDFHLHHLLKFQLREGELEIDTFKYGYGEDKTPEIIAVNHQPDKWDDLKNSKQDYLEDYYSAFGYYRNKTNDTFSQQEDNWNIEKLGSEWNCWYQCGDSNLFLYVDGVKSFFDTSNGASPVFKMIENDLIDN